MIQKTVQKTVLFVLILALMLPTTPSSFADMLVSLPKNDDSMTDHQAEVFAVGGTVQILRSDEESWVDLKQGDTIYEGDQVRAEKNSFAEINYDNTYLNRVRIEEETTMEFESIEDTQLHLVEGSLLNELKGLVEGTEYELSTPVTVSAVRGTEFLRRFDPDTLEDETSVITGAVDVAPFDAQGQVNFERGFQVTKENKIQFNREMIESRNFQAAKPTRLPAAERARIQKIQQASHKRLERFAGGPERLKKGRERFQALKQNPGRVKQMRQRMGRPQNQARNRNQHNQHQNFQNQGPQRRPQNARRQNLGPQNPRRFEPQNNANRRRFGPQNQAGNAQQNPRRFGPQQNQGPKRFGARPQGGNNQGLRRPQGGNRPRAPQRKK